MMKKQIDCKSIDESFVSIYDQQRQNKNTNTNYVVDSTLEFQYCLFFIQSVSFSCTMLHVLNTISDP